MKRAIIVMFVGISFAMHSGARAQVAGSTLVGVAAVELRAVATGWSAKRDVIGKPVFNDQNDKIGQIDDVVISPEKSISYVIINAGGYLRIAKHDVAVSVSDLKLVNGELVLAGATRDALQASPRFEYAPR